jgi:hypothetical protein
MVNIRNYLIELDGRSWGKLLAPWSPPLPARFTVWMVNRLGDVLAVFEDQSVHFLDVGRGDLSRIADNREDFVFHMDQDSNANDWLAIPLVDHCVFAGLILKPGQCYGYKTPPVLGGDYAIDNLVPTDLSEHFEVLGDLFRQIRDLPDGATVDVEIVD